MKNAFLLFAIIIGFCGCTQKPDPQVAKLESQVAMLQSNVALLKMRQDNTSNYLDWATGIITNLVEISATNVNDIKVIAAYSLENDFQTKQLSGTLSNLISTLNASHPGQASFRIAQSPPGQMPAAVAARIRSDAQLQWPSDYEMQVYEIKKQTEAWRKLNP